MKTEQRATSVAIWASGAATLVGTIGVVSHLSGTYLLPLWPPGSVSIALWPSFIFALLGASLIALCLRPASGAVRGAVIAVAFVGFTAAVVTFIAHLTGSGFDIELLEPIRRLSRLTPPARRSTGPLGAPVLMFASLALLVLATGRLRALAGVLASIPLLAGVLVGVGFFYDSPVLRVNNWRPISLAAALATTLFGTALIAAAGPAVWPLRPLVGPSVRAQLLRWFMPFTVLVVLGTDVLTVNLFSSYSPALGSVINTLMSMACAAAVTYFVARRIGDRLDRAERETIRVKRLYDVLSSTSALVTRAREPRTLFETACAIAVEKGGFDVAWVGEVDRDLKVIRPVAMCGISSASFDGMTISFDDAAQERGPTAQAVHDGRPFVCSDLLHHPGLDGIAKDRILQTGLRASASFPLTTLGESTHVYSIYARELGWFTVEQISLLERLATDLSYALGAMAKERKRGILEEQLRQAQKMETIGQLAGGIAHDFNNMLSIVMANTELVSSTLPPEYVEAAAELRDVRDAAGRGKALVRQLMSFSRVGNLEFDTTDIGALAERVIRMLRRMLPESVIVECTVEAGLPPGWADPGAVEQIILNLSTNARDAMPNGGRLQVAVRRPDASDPASEAPRAGDAAQYVCLAVSDTGTGMNAATLERVFDPFFTTKPPGEGTGLGLAMVQGIMRQHGGFARITSQVGQGTSVRLFFPTSKGGIAGPVVDAMRSSPEALRGTETVLVVEDEEPLRRAVQRILERHGYRVLTADDGMTALEILRRPGVTIDLILTDLIMPRLGGAELYQQVSREFGRRKFLIASGYNPGEAAAGNGPPRDVPFIRKPWTLVEVLEAVRKALEAPAS